MPHGSSARRNWLRTIILGSALAAGAGCAGKDKTDTGLRSLDPRAKAALTTPEGPKPLVTPKVAVGDPNATGLTNLTAKESFNRTRPFLPAGTSTGSASLTQPGAGVPITPTSGGTLVPQRPAEYAQFGAPPALPFDGPLPKPNEIVPVSDRVPVPLDNPAPSDVPAPPKPIVPAGNLPAPAPPPAPPDVLPVAPTDTALVPIPSPTEKQVTGFPIAPGIVK